MKNLVRAGLSLLALAAIPNVPAGLVFNFNGGSGMTPAAMNGFIEAGNRWSSLFNDNVTININVDMISLGAGILGQSGSVEYRDSYFDYRNLMTADQTSAVDSAALAGLPGGTTLNALMNFTTQNSGSATPYLDNNNSHNNQFFISSSAQEKALGAIPNTGLDAVIDFNSSFNFDYDPSNGISPGFYDFVGVATHEIGHAMGFFSGVDDRAFVTSTLGHSVSEDAGSVVLSPTLTVPTEASVMDWFRYSGADARDWTFSNTTKYFSLDNGATPIAQFSNGLLNGDGRQASHWKDGLNLGIMDPTAGPGELLAISANDIEMLDALGWNPIEAQPVPEAGTAWAGLAFLSLGAFEIRRRQNARQNFSAKI